MKIGVPRERKELEKRVAITPDGAKQLTAHGHTVLIETDAGLNAGFSDSEYNQAGAQIVQELSQVWNDAEMVVKVKEPHPDEYQYFRPGLLLFDYLHLASMPEVTHAMLKSGITGVAYELVYDSDGTLPLLEPMSEIAGKLSVLNGASYLLSQNGGRGILLGGAVGVPRANVTIVGAGVSGRAACSVAFGMGAHVHVFDINTKKLDSLQAEFGNQISTAFSTPAALKRTLTQTDLLIGAVLIPGAAAPKLISKEMIQAMPNGSVFVDISIDQGGCGETIRPTSLENPVYTEEGVIHYGVCNMPAQTARTSTMALTNATLPYITKIANASNGTGDTTTDTNRALLGLKRCPELLEAMNTHQGKLTNKKVSEAVGVTYTPITDAFGKE